MNTTASARKLAFRLPRLAALTCAFLAAGTNGHLDAATPWLTPVPMPHAAPAPTTTAAPQGNIHILSAEDAALYRAAFAAQESGDVATADVALGKITDKRLVGHVLADRYLGQGMSVAQAQQWLVAYADLPEAVAIYKQARGLRGFAAAHIKAPPAPAVWVGNNGGNLSSGFRGDNDNEIPADRVAAKINAALHRGNPTAARAMLAAETQRGAVSLGVANETTSRIAAALFYTGDIAQARPLAQRAAAAGIPLALWIDGLAAWKQSDYVTASRSFASLAQAPGLAPWDRAAAAYWAYRAARHMGDVAQARHWLVEAARYPRCFYGYMAASQLGNAPARSWAMPELTAENIAVLAQRPAGGRALALAQIGRIDLAEGELRHLNPAGRHDMETAIMALAEQAHMPALTLQLGGLVTDGKGRMYEAALYPLPPWQPSNGFKVDRALIFALMKHESQFDPAAVSDRGACGLMQIMPATARAIGNDVSGSHCSTPLFDPARNMEMGQSYVRLLSQQPMIGDNLLLLLAAYNGGPGNVARWLDGSDRADPLFFVESLPVRETRDYVQQVLMHYWIYRDRLHESPTSVAQLARGEWPRYALREDAVKEAGMGGVVVASVK